MNKELFEYLKSSWDELERDYSYNDAAPGLGDSKIYNYLYFATLIERFPIHKLERTILKKFGMSVTRRNENDILAFKPYFEASLAKEGITTISDLTWPKTLAVSDATIGKIVNNIKMIEDDRSILNAILCLKMWWVRPDFVDGVEYHGKLAWVYLSCVESFLNRKFKNDKKFKPFLKWLMKKTMKGLIWSSFFKKKNLRDPPVSARPIYMGEAASYVRYFLELSCNPNVELWQHYAEMSIYLALNLACAQQYSRKISAVDILNVTSGNLSDYTPPATTPYFSSDVILTAKGSKGSPHYRAILVGVSHEFLKHPQLWDATSQQLISETNVLRPQAEVIKVEDAEVIISLRLAKAIKLMSSFSITKRDVDNRLKEAYDKIGLIQSTGGISSSCFLVNPYPWHNVDVRKARK